MDLLCYLSFYPVALGWRRSTLRLYSHFPNSTVNYIFREIREIRAKLIVNCQFSIVNLTMAFLGTQYVDYQ